MSAFKFEPVRSNSSGFALLRNMLDRGSTPLFRGSEARFGVQPKSAPAVVERQYLFYFRSLPFPPIHIRFFSICFGLECTGIVFV